MIAFIAKKIIYPKEISEFGKPYVFLRHLGTDYRSGHYENYFVKLRIALLVGLKHLREPPKLDILKEAFYDANPDIKKDIDYNKLEKAIRNGIGKKNSQRFIILDFVTRVTKQYSILYAALALVNFQRSKEFQIIYRNFAIQSSNSKEKRENLLNIRTIAVEKLIDNTEKAISNLNKGIKIIEENDNIIQEKKKKRIRKIEKKKKEVSTLFQENLMFATTYTISDKTLMVLLQKMDFRKKGSFRTFYKHLVFIDNCKNKNEEYVRKERLEQRQRVVYWVMISKNKAFIQEALSYVFTYESSERILKDILAFIDKEEDEGGLGKITLKIPISSFNYDMLSEHKKRRESKGKTEETVPISKPSEEEKKECEHLLEDIQHQGMWMVLGRFLAKGDGLEDFVRIINNAILLDLLEDTEEIGEIKREIAKFAWKTAQKIRMKPKTGTSSAKIIKEEETSKEDDQKFAKVAQSIIDSRAGIKL